MIIQMIKLPIIKLTKATNIFEFTDGNIIQVLEVKNHKEIYFDPGNNIAVFRLDVIAKGASSSKTTIDLLNQTNKIVTNIVNEYSKKGITAFGIIVGDMSEQFLILSNNTSQHVTIALHALSKNCLKIHRIVPKLKFEKDLKESTDRIVPKDSHDFALNFNNISELNKYLKSYLKSPNFKVDLEKKLSENK